MACPCVLNPRSNSSVPMMLLTVKGTVLTCGKRGVDVRPDFNWNNKVPVGAMGYGIASARAEIL